MSRNAMDLKTKAPPGSVIVFLSCSVSIYLLQAYFGGSFVNFLQLKCASLLPFDLKGQLSFLTLTLYCYHVICTELSQLLIINFILSYNQITDYECNNITMLWQINCQCILVLLFY